MAAGTSALGLAGGPIGIGITAGLAGLGAVTSLITGHKTAVANEAQALNTAFPRYTASIQQLFAALNAGQITEAQAKTGLDTAVSQYYSDVSGGYRGAIQGRWTLTNTSTCVPSTAPKTCNGPCIVGGQWVEPWACQLKKIIDRGGTWSENPPPSHAGFSGGTKFTIVYNKKAVQAAVAKITSTAHPIGLGKITEALGLGGDVASVQTAGVVGVAFVVGLGALALLFGTRTNRHGR